MKRLKISSSGGFTLVEVMVVVAIVAILAALAFPGYENHLRKTRRATAQAFLMTVAARQKEFLIVGRTYSADLATLNLAVPNDVSTYYDIDFSPASTATTFNVRAKPKGTQLKDLGGANLELDQDGTKKPAGKW